ncbi:hypothetical protein GY45DRAFT_1374309 [Cubamyces sp. BRFM 1775]|nr:hypothetical protein GY45DRAFT_1374309 [Cubamyces sp. BRFM 1775]
MSSRKDCKSSTHPNAPLSTDPHGISFTLVPPTPPPTSPNNRSSFAAAQANLKQPPAKSKLSGQHQAKAKKAS